MLVSRHFTLERIADGVYAALAAPGAGAGSNAGIVDLGDRTLVFDTFLTPQAAQDLRAAAEALTGRPVRHVANSHYHADHVAGNQVFAPEGQVIATPRMRELIAEKNAALIAELRAHGAEYIATAEARIRAESDPARQRALEIGLATDREFISAADTVRIVLPDVTFEERLVLHGSARTAELVTFGAGHTESDVVLYLPSERIAFVGDLGFFHSHTWAGDGSPADWARVVPRVLALGAEVIVPGHGPVGTPADLEGVGRYVGDIARLAQDAAARGIAPEDVPVPEEYREWDGVDMFVQNLKALGARAAG
jgi:cyclase